MAKKRGKVSGELAVVVGPAAEVSIVYGFDRGTPAPMPTAARSGVPWGRMFWPGGIPPTEAHKGLLDWH